MHGGVWLLITQKPVNRPCWWKGKFALSLMLATGRGRVVDICPKVDSPTPGKQGVRAFIDRVGSWLHVETHSHLNSHLQIGHQWPDWHHLGCLDTVHRQFSGPLFYLFVVGSRTAAARVLGPVWLSCA